MMKLFWIDIQCVIVMACEQKTISFVTFENINKFVKHHIAPVYPFRLCIYVKSMKISCKHLT